jgi:hypothetical protein
MAVPTVFVPAFVILFGVLIDNRRLANLAVKSNQTRQAKRVHFA